MSDTDPEKLNSILATDCGSTTTKAILIERRGSEYRLIVRGEAPTTVEAPFEDVTRGVLNSIMEVEELAGRKILDGERIITPQKGTEGVDLYISTSSAGGGLQMMVSGVVKSMTGESAQRAALGAGAIVMDVIASNDGRLPHEKIKRIRHLRPDMILLSGGVDGGTTSHVAEMAELLAAADPKARLGAGYELPVIYAGNKNAIDIVKERLGKKVALVITENLRPVLERENLGPARDKIHDLFMEHVMAHAPGYKKLMTWSPVPIMPTPGAVGLIIETIAREEKIQVIGVDIGGATTDVFSVFQGVFNRTVSANLGMSYSVSNVLAEAGLPNIMRWVPFDIEERDLRNRIKNKMIRPTTIPQSLEELIIEQAIAREALRLAFEQHKSLAVGLKGGKEGAPALRVTLELPGGLREEFALAYGSLRLVPLDLGETAKATLRPEKGFDVGEGKGKERVVTLKGGVVGLVFDCRGRQPFRIPEDRAARIAKLNQWNEALRIYPTRDAREVSTAELRPLEARV